MNIFTKKKKSESIDNILNIINIGLKNNELYDYITNKYRNITSSKCSYYDFFNGITIFDKESCDSFTIYFSPSIENYTSISTRYTCWEGARTELKNILYMENTICVREINLTKYSDTNNLLDSIKKESSKRIYKDNQLIFMQQFESATYIDERDFSSYSKEEITHITPEKKAVQKITCVGDIKSFHPTGTEYFITNYYDEPPFNTREENNILYQTGMKKCTEEEYQEFIKNISIPIIEDEMILAKK